MTHHLDIRRDQNALAADEQALLPTEEDVAFYRTHGWYRSPVIIPDSLLAEAMAGADRHFSGERDWQLPPTKGFSDWKASDGNVIRNAEVVALQNREIRTLVTSPLLGAIAARLTGSPTIRYFADTLVYKPPDLPDTESVVGWHTDRSYWWTCTSENMLTAWIPFHDVDEETGTLLYVDGSHRWSDTGNLRTFRDKDHGWLKTRFAGQAEIVTVPMNLRKGQVSFHTCRLIHGSGPNRSGRPRLALGLHLQDGANRYRVYLNQQGIPWHIFNDDLARKSGDGTPDYTDPQVFPVLWSETMAAVPNEELAL